MSFRKAQESRESAATLFTAAVESKSLFGQIGFAVLSGCLELQAEREEREAVQGLARLADALFSGKPQESDRLLAARAELAAAEEEAKIRILRAKARHLRGW